MSYENKYFWITTLEYHHPSNEMAQQIFSTFLH